MRWARQQPGLAVTWIAIALFYVWHLLHQYVVPGETRPIAFHLWSTVLAVIWASGAWGFQRALLKYGGRSRILFAWATMDVLLLTLLSDRRWDRMEPPVGLSICTFPSLLSLRCVSGRILWRT